MSTITMVLLTGCYFIVAARIYYIYMPACNSAKPEMNPLIEVVIAVASLLWLPLLMVLIVVLFIGIIVVTITDTDRINNLLTKYQRKTK